MEKGCTLLCKPHVYVRFRFCLYYEAVKLSVVMCEIAYTILSTI